MRTATNITGWLTSSVTILGATALLLVGCSQLTFAQTSQAKTFVSAGQAAHALYEAVKGNDEPALRAILGAGPELTSSGSDTEDKQNRERFVQKYEEMHRVVREPDGTAFLHVGAENWPFPIPLVSKNGKWYFDADAGSQELLARVIGRNEITAIQVCQRAQKANGQNTEKPDGQDPIREFAAALASQNDANPADREPFNGYYFRSVAGAKPSDVVLIAYPAEYRSSGVMTFIVTRSGSVYEKDLGPQTPTVAQQVQGAPAKGWVPVQQNSMP
jgi:hypothetical protein